MRRGGRSEVSFSVLCCILFISMLLFPESLVVGSPKNVNSRLLTGSTQAFASAHFALDTVAPTITIVSPENQTYTTRNVPLTFSVDEACSWIGYSLDNSANATISGNTTLSGLANTSHQIILYANDTTGNMAASALICFSVWAQTIYENGLTVNTGDTLVIDSCDLIVRNGGISISGTLNITNTTVYIQDPRSRYKSISVADGGTLNLVNTVVVGLVAITDYAPSSIIRICDSSLPDTKVVTRSNCNFFSNSSFGSWVFDQGDMTAMNCNFSLEVDVWVSIAVPYRDLGSTMFASGCRFNILLPVYSGSGDLEFKRGMIDEFRLYDEHSGGNLTLVDTYVENWLVDIIAPATISNSQIFCLSLFVALGWSGNITLPAGYIDYMNVSFAIAPLVIVNSTVDNFSLEVDYSSSIQILNSENVSLELYEPDDSNANLTMNIVNSHLGYVQLTQCVVMEATLAVTNSTIDQFCWDDYGLTTCVTGLKEGFNDFSNISLPERGCTLTLNDSYVYHWTFTGCDGGLINITDSKLSYSKARSDLNVYDSALCLRHQVSCFAQNSTIDVVICQSGASLNLTSCSVGTLYAYSDLITAVNSTIDLLVTDPIPVALTDSKILLELDLSAEMSGADSFLLSCSDQLVPCLRHTRFSKYMNVTSTYNGYFEGQGRIFYNETELQGANVDQSALEMYYLDNNGRWQLCPVQGVDTVDKFVWANVTELSCFVLGTQNVIADITGGTPNLLDFVPDGQVDMKDVGTVARFFNQNVPPAPPECDVTGPTLGVPDGKVDMRDVGTVARHFGEHYP